MACHLGKSIGCYEALRKPRIPITFGDVVATIAWHDGYAHDYLFSLASRKSSGVKSLAVHSVPRTAGQNPPSRDPVCGHIYASVLLVSFSTHTARQPHAETRRQAATRRMPQPARCTKESIARAGTQVGASSMRCELCSSSRELSCSAAATRSGPSGSRKRVELCKQPVLEGRRVGFHTSYVRVAWFACPRLEWW